MSSKQFRRYVLLIALSLAGAILSSPSGAQMRAPADWQPGVVMTANVMQILDGDTLRVRAESGVADVRLDGVDAPEWDQECLDKAGHRFACGQVATWAMADILHAVVAPCPSGRMHGLCVRASLPVECAVIDIDREWGRPVARCRVNGIDVAEGLASMGYVWSIRPHPYLMEVGMAWLNRRGFWGGTFRNPQLWRRAAHPPAAATGVNSK